ncbi:MAG: DUF58 domain-containing protein [Nitrospirota bacterium]|nr:DUF58 domain-containing protein [Nitrospirota bacterium]
MAIRIYYFLLRLVSGLRHSLSQRATTAGLLVLAGLAGSAVLGMDTTKNAAHEAFTLLAALVLVAFLINRRFRPSLELRRDLPRFGTAGQPFTYRITLRNTGHRLLRNLSLTERFSDPRPSFAEFSARVEYGYAHGRKWIRDSMYRDWRMLTDRDRIAEPTRQDLPIVPARGVTELSLDLVPLRRGRLQFEALAVGRSDPFGLFRSVRAVPSAQSILILPKRYPLPQMRLGGGRKYHQGGVTLASNIGNSDEFMSLRDYRQGDPLRNIHWKSWARTGRPVVKEHADEFFARHALVLDTFSPGEDRVFEEALSVAASFLAQVETNDSLLDLMFVGNEAYCITTGRSIGRAERALEVLACARACPDRSLDSLESLVLGRAGLLSSCICVLLAWDRERRDFVGKLQALGIPVKVIVVQEPAGRPLDPGPMSGRLESFHVLETGKIAEGMMSL